MSSPSSGPRIIVDGKVPHVSQALSRLGQVVSFVPPDPPAQLLHQAHALITRSVTRVDGALLARAPALRFVGSATAGVDHVDVAALSARGVGFAHAPGANARAVAEYVVAALARAGTGSSAVVGVVGFGHVGRQVTALLRGLGYRVLVNDPPLARRVEADDTDVPAVARTEAYVPLVELANACDVLTCHVPLVPAGPDATVHLVSRAILARLGPGLIVNTARGGVVDESALVAAPGVRAALDVWEGEPEPDGALMGELGARLILATPHIAGYTLEAKLRGTAMIFRALASHLGQPARWEGRADPGEAIELSPRASLAHAMERVLGLEDQDAALRQVAGQADGNRATAFEALRKTTTRHEVAAHAFHGGSAEVRRALRVLGARMESDDLT